MSKKHPVIAITGSSGAGTSTVKGAFRHIFSRLHVTPIIIEGDSFHRYDREEMKRVLAKEEAKGNNYFSHFGPEANHFDKIEKTFKDFGEKGVCRRRYYLHNEEEAEPFGLKPGEFTPWEDMGDGSDLLFYEGLHGGVKCGDIDVSKYVDLLIGVVPVVNLEWIQKFTATKKNAATLPRRPWTLSTEGCGIILITLPHNFQEQILIFNAYQRLIHPIHLLLEISQH